jgi:anthranilate phosphoribosyltransferase
VIEQALMRVVSGETLARDEMRGVLEAIVSGDAEPLVVAGLLSALRMRGETVDEITGAAEAMRALAVSLPAAPPGAIDTCGTGGDGSNTFNISTLAALVVAACGVPVVKHGNRAATSSCGSAELLEALGIDIELPPERMAAAVTEVGIGFLYARSCHPAMAAVAPIRKALPIATLFNRLGPLTNPMRPSRQLLGVGRRDMLEPALQVLERLGVERVWVVHGSDGLDEVSTCARTDVAALEDGVVRQFVLEPGAHVPSASLEDLRGGGPEKNAAIARDILDGKRSPRRDIVVLNAAAALCVAGTVDDIDAGVVRAAEALDSGEAQARLARWVEFTGGQGAA